MLEINNEWNNNFKKIYDFLKNNNCEFEVKWRFGVKRIFVYGKSKTLYIDDKRKCKREEYVPYIRIGCDDGEKILKEGHYYVRNNGYCYYVNYENLTKDILKLNNDI